RGENGVTGAIVHNVQVSDTGQQLLKGSISDNGKNSRDILVACSSFEYSDHAPSDYTNGVDVLGGRGWTVRDNKFNNIRGPAERRYAAGPTILFWRDSRDMIIVRNLVTNCCRGIAVGLQPTGVQPGRDPKPYLDAQQGIVFSNVVCNLQDWCDEGIEVNAARDVRIEHNTVLRGGQSLPWAISIRFPPSTAVVRNNLTNKPIVDRDGARHEAAGNVTDADLHWFVNTELADLRLVS